LSGMKHSLEAATRLEFLQRFVNLSSGLVLGEQMQSTALSEGNIASLDFTRVHNVYAESRRSAENLSNLYASQFRIPTSTARAFTFLGPYQSLDAPWAANNFIRDALTGNDIRIHGAGATRRSYLYGSDVASWLLRILIDGQDGEVYNIGGQNPVSHEAMAKMTASLTVPSPKLSYKSQSARLGRCHDFFPDVSKAKLMLGLSQAFDTEYAVRRTMQWHARRNGLMRRLRENDSAS
jgi:nucleoside-diphosphate-sugar epimerase